MKFIIKLTPEIVIKSKPVRLRFTKILTRNIRNILRRYDESLVVLRHWDHLEIYTESETFCEMIYNVLIQIPGIHHVLEVKENSFTSLQEIFEKTLIECSDQIKEKTFCVRAKRHGKHKFSSMEIERYVGNELDHSIKSSRVKLKNPDVTINLEIRKNRFFLVKNRYEGIGGFPIGTQEDVLSLISGGFDSSVASYMLIRRGCRVHYCFFNLGGIKHEIGVRQISYYLWNRFGSSHNVRFISINFRLILDEIFEKIDASQMGVVLKRMMFRVASKVAKSYGIQTLVTGESLGQVSTQTLTNLRIIEDVSDALILRPLAAYDKEHIINIARKIGTEKIANSIPEYCSFTSKSPTTKAIKSKIEAEEANFDLAILEKVIKEAVSFDIYKVSKNFDFGIQGETQEVEIVNSFGNDDIILDIRPISEQCKNPLKIKNAKIISLPFYKLRKKFSSLDQNKTWLLWCKSGMMSRLQALHLHEQGFLNVKVYRPLI